MARWTVFTLIEAPGAPLSALTPHFPMVEISYYLTIITIHLPSHYYYLLTKPSLLSTYYLKIFTMY